MSTYTILMPNIEDVIINPNPVVQNASIDIKVEVSEITVQLTPEIKYSGEFYLGEV